MEAVILTPDQRLRVFVSSVLHELETERAAARAAIESLRLTPVMFEAGARSHPPRALYRSYLQQSDVFVGIYGASYGSVAPDMHISGIEDEWELARGKPQLVYVKEGVEPEPRMAELLERLQAAGDVSYKRFGDATELAELLKTDLMVLLTERFEAVVESEPGKPQLGAVSLPAQTTAFIGRERQLDGLVELITAGESRLITMVGPGGIGKTRLALEAAARVKDAFPGGVYLVQLADVLEPGFVPDRILRTLSVRGSDTGSSLDSLVDVLSDKKVLLILDNFEQILDAAGFVSDLLAALPELQLLVTSRAPLRIRGEHELEVPPLGSPHEGGEPSSWEDSESIRLFIDRALSVRPELAIDESTAKAIAEICRRLDGLPLAIELAAAQVRILPPQRLLERLTVRLPLLKGGARDMPERHQRLQNTIAWSFDLLDAEAQTLFRRLGAFRGGFTLEAAEEICGYDGLDVLNGLSALIDQSLIRNGTLGGEPRFMMLETISEFATDLLRSTPDAELVQERHARYFAEMARVGGIASRTAGQQAELDRFERELFNMRAAASWLLSHGEADVVAEALWEAWWGWWTRGYLRQGRLWADRTASRKDELSPLAYAKARATVGALAFWQNDLAVGIEAFQEALVIFQEERYERGLALCDLALGLLSTFMGEDAAQGQERIRTGLETFLRIGDRGGASMSSQALCWTHVVRQTYDGNEADFTLALSLAEEVGADIDIGMAQGNLGMLNLHQGNESQSLAYLVEGLERLARVRHFVVAANLLNQLGEVAVRQGRYELTLTLTSAGQSIRDRIGAITPLPSMQRYEECIRQASEHLPPGATEVALERGRALEFDEAVRLALDEMKPVSV